MLKCVGSKEEYYTEVIATSNGSDMAVKSAVVLCTLLCEDSLSF